MTTKEPLVSVTVLVDDSALPRIRSLARRLEQAGLKIAEVQEMTGTITGTIPTKKMGMLTKVEGVSAVEEGRQVSIPPPGSDVQ
jgi:hypothetical protein